MSVNGKTAAAARLFAKLALIGSKMDGVSYRAELAVLAGVFADKDVVGGLMAPSQKKVVREKLYIVIDRHFSGRLKVPDLCRLVLSDRPCETECSMCRHF